MIENLFIYTDIFSNFFPIIIFIIYWKASRSNIGLCLILLYVILNFTINFIVTVTKTSYTLSYEGLTLAEYLLFSGFIYYQIKNKKFRIFIILAGIAFSIFFFGYTFLVKATTGIDSVPIGVETILMITFCFFYLYEQMNDTTTLFIYSKAPFWIILAIVLYLAGCFFIYIFANYIDAKQVEKYWVVTNLFGILKNTLFAIAIWMNAKPAKDNLPYDLKLSSLN